MAFADNKQKLIAVLRDAREFLARPDNDFAWSSWEDAASALRELDGLLARLGSGELPDRSTLEVLFLPTGPIQEVSVSSGWGDEFLKLASRFDRALIKVYGPDPKRLATQNAAIYASLKEGFDGRGRWLWSALFVLSLGFLMYLKLAHEKAEIYWPVRLSGRAAENVLLFAALFYAALVIVNWFSWTRKKRK
jgi:hypothetical protein